MLQSRARLTKLAKKELLPVATSVVCPLYLQTSTDLLSKKECATKNHRHMTDLESIDCSPPMELTLHLLVHFESHCPLRRPLVVLTIKKNGHIRICTFTYGHA